MRTEIDSFLDKPQSTPRKNVVVRLTTSAWKSNRGVHIRRDVLILKKLSDGAYDLLTEECDQIGAIEVFQRIVNLDECKDGIYVVVTCNEHKDWETGNLEDWDYKLLKYESLPK